MNKFFVHFDGSPNRYFYGLQHANSPVKK